MEPPPPTPARLTPGFLVSCASSRKAKGQEDEEFLGKLQHLRLESKGVRSALGLELCEKLVTLHLNNNRLCTTRGLGGLRELRELYLQDNFIESLDGLQTLTELTKLVLDHNCLACVAGLDRNEKLRELHLARQKKIVTSGQLTWDPTTLRNLNACLEVLVCSGNRMTQLPRDFGAHLTHLDLACNELSDLGAVGTQLAVNFPLLQKLEMQGNPIAQDRKYRATMVSMLPALELLDGKDIPEREREFLKHLQH